MSLLNMPSEIFQQVLYETLIVSYETFIGLRLVHSHFNDMIQESAEHLMKRLFHARSLPVRFLSLHQPTNQPRADTKCSDQTFPSLLRLYSDVAFCIQLEAVFDEYRKKFASISIWPHAPTNGFGNFESLLVFLAFQRELIRSIKVCDDPKSSMMIARADPDKNSFEWLQLDQRFMDFVHIQMTVHDLQALMTMVNFCAVSTCFMNKVLDARYQGQGEQLESALLAECMLWRGPLWLAKKLHQIIERDSSTTDDDLTLWAGSRAEAGRIVENGVVRFLQKERARKLETERVAP